MKSHEEMADVLIL